MRTNTRIALAFLPFLAFGCGGNGSAVDSSPLSGTNNAASTAYSGPNKGSINFFVTNSSGDSYDHAWVVLKKVDLRLAAGGNRTIYQDPQGVGIDLAHLHNASNPVYQFLSGLAVPVGTYTGAEITVSRQAVFFPAKTDKAMGADFPGKGEGADCILTMDFDAPKVLGSASDNFVLDFNLGEWQSKDEKLDPRFKVAAGVGVEAAKPSAPTFLQGQIAELKGKSPEFTFVVRNDKGVDMSVHISASTGVRNLGPKSKLANGSWIELAGIFDVVARRYEAGSITLAEQKDQLSQATLQGEVSNLDEHSGKFQVEPAATRGFAPTSLKVGVSAKGAATLDIKGQAIDKIAFYKALAEAKGAQVQVRGSFDPKQQVFTATEVRLSGDVKPAPKTASDPQMLKA